MKFWDKRELPAARGSVGKFFSVDPFTTVKLCFSDRKHGLKMLQLHILAHSDH